MDKIIPDSIIKTISWMNPDDHCAWKLADCGAYTTSCNNEFLFNNGGPKDNGFGFCPYCGDYITEQPNMDDEAITHKDI